MNPGLDKIVLNKLDIKNIDFNKLQSYDNVSIHYGAAGTYPPIFIIANYQPVSSICINDNEKFLDLKIGVKQIKGYGTYQVYSLLSLCVYFRDGNNFQSLSVGDYLNYIDCVLTYIFDIYGIELSLAADTGLSYAEIAYTVPMHISRLTFYQMSSLFISFLPKTFKNAVSHSSTITDSSIGNKYIKSNATMLPCAQSRGNQSIEFMIYIKHEAGNKETKSVTTADKMLIRFEIKLLTSEKIKACLGSNKISYITDSMIKNFYMNFFEKNIIRKWYSWKSKTKSCLMKLFSQCKKDYGQNWITYSVLQMASISITTRLPFIVDLSQIYDALPPNSRNNRNNARIKRSFKRQLSNGEYNFWFCEDDKLIDLFIDELKKDCL